jgi:hypothetical protein
MEKTRVEQNELSVIQPSSHHVILVMNQLSLNQFFKLRFWIKKNLYTHLILPYTYPGQRMTIWLKNEGLIIDKKLKNEFYDFIFNPFTWLMECGHYDCFLEYILGNSVKMRSENMHLPEVIDRKQGRISNWKISRGNVLYVYKERPLFCLKFSGISSEKHLKSLFLNRMDVIEFFSPNGIPKPKTDSNPIKSTFHLSYVVEPQVPTLIFNRY